MPSSLSVRSKAFLGVVLCVGVWGVNYPATKIAYQELSPLAYTGWRFLIAAALILGWAVRNGAPVLPPRGLRRYGLLLALTGIGVYQPIFAIGVERTSGFAAALLNSVSPLLALLIVAALGYERIPRLAVAGTAVAWCGVAGFLVAAHGSVDLGGLSGNLLCLVSATFWAIYSVSSSRLSGRIPHATALATTFAFGTPVLLAYCAPSMARQNYARRLAPSPGSSSSFRRSSRSTPPSGSGRTRSPFSASPPPPGSASSSRSSRGSPPPSGRGSASRARSSPRPPSSSEGSRWRGSEPPVTSSREPPASRAGATFASASASASGSPSMPVSASGRVPSPRRDRARTCSATARRSPARVRRSRARTSRRPDAAAVGTDRRSLGFGRGWRRPGRGGCRVVLRGPGSAEEGDEPFGQRLGGLLPERPRER